MGPRTCGLAGKPFIDHFRLHLPSKRSGHEGVHDPVQPAWNDSGTVFDQTAEALRYALLGESNPMISDLRDLRSGLHGFLD